MKKRISRQHESSSKSSISSRFILSTILIISTLVVLVFLFAFRVISIPEYIFEFFSEKNDNVTDSNGECVISDIVGDGKDETYIFEVHDKSARELLLTLSESKVYQRALRTIYYSDEDTFVERITITHSGKRFRIENGLKTFIYDGATLYISQPTFTQKYEGEFTIYNEIGITPLSYLQERIDVAEVYFKDEINQKRITVIITDGVGYTEYEVSVENGLVLTERSYYNNEVYRAVITDKIEIMEHSAPSNDFFIIP